MKLLDKYSESIKEKKSNGSLGHYLDRVSNKPVTSKLEELLDSRNHIYLSPDTLMSYLLENLSSALINPKIGNGDLNIPPILDTATASFTPFRRASQSSIGIQYPYINGWSDNNTSHNIEKDMKVKLTPPNLPSFLCKRKQRRNFKEARKRHGEILYVTQRFFDLHYFSMNGYPEEREAKESVRNSVKDAYEGFKKLSTELWKDWNLTDELSIRMTKSFLEDLKSFNKNKYSEVQSWSAMYQVTILNGVPHLKDKRAINVYTNNLLPVDALLKGDVPLESFILKKDNLVDLLQDVDVHKCIDEDSVVRKEGGYDERIHRHVIKIDVSTESLKPESPFISLSESELTNLESGDLIFVSFNRFLSNV